MAANNIISNSLNAFLHTLRILSCRRILAKGRAMQISGQWPNISNDDVFDCWRRTLGVKDKLPDSYVMNVTYLDTGIGSDPIGTVLMSHGTPGSHNDFKYIIPTLIEKRIRSIAPNFPGFGHTDVPKYFQQSNDERAEFLVDCTDAAGLKKVDTIVGHSAGCYPLLKVATDGDLTSINFCRSLVLINPGGFLALHRGMQPLWLSRLGAKLSYTSLSWAIKWIAYFFWRYVLGMRTISPEGAVQGMRMAANVGIKQYPEMIHRLATDPSAPRVLIMYAEDDQFVELERCVETATALGIDLERTIHVSSKDDIENALELIRKWWVTKDESRHAAVYFKKGLGGHYLQKHQAPFIVSCIEILIGNCGCS